jgi:hypothetical protein
MESKVIFHAVRHFGLILDLINYDFDDVTSCVNHIKLL